MADKETPSTYMKEELKAPDGWNFFVRTDKFNENLEIGWEKDNESLDLGIVKKLYKSVLEYTDDEGTMFLYFKYLREISLKYLFLFFDVL